MWVFNVYSFSSKKNDQIIKNQQFVFSHKLNVVNYSSNFNFTLKCFIEKLTKIAKKRRELDQKKKKKFCKNYFVFYVVI